MRKKYTMGLLVLCGLIFFLFNACGRSSAEEVKEIDLSIYEKGDYFISPEELKTLLGTENLILLDCNNPKIYAKEHIKGAIGIGFHAFSEKVGKPGDPGWGTIKSKDELREKLISLGIDDKKIVVLYSDLFKGPGADGRTAWQLTLAGMKNVKILHGGSSYWKELGYEMTKNVTVKPTPSAGVTLKDYDRSFMITKDELFKNLDKETIIDARTKKEFDGSQKAGEPRGGHIKGAKHLLWTELLNRNGTLKTPIEIEEIMDKMDISKKDDLTLY
ncbi:rhodanese-like domain-containing protein [Psychrilyobacter sp.]|uniref:sulfurtransferase n=1 Tax=Psychrilyobacter sp. TaxID=2586924 RepID=UPI0030198B74